ncbi:MAG TPA: ABC transporter permease [Candidatus Acidoferrales bacterium]|nr:ABC transporter permease [Candidatus Acidoferrales bacterium]
MTGLLHDLRYAIRMLLKNPGFTATVVLTLALGIGANTAIFSVVDGVLLRPLPFDSPDRLVHLTGKFAMSDQAGISPPDYLDYRSANRTFEQMAVLSYEAGAANLSGNGRPEQVMNVIASWNLFDALGIRPILGRSFVPADEQFALPQVTILGNSIWRTHFGADPHIVGKSVTLDDRSLTVIGVISSDPSILSKTQVWLPLPLLNKGMNVRVAHFLMGVGKLKPGITIEQAQADLDSDAREIDARYPESNKGWGIKIRSLSGVLVGPVRPQLLMISGAVGLLLLIACANVANLLLARGEARQRELAVRKALGASRGRIMQQILTESFVLACSGGAAGFMAATWGVEALRAVAPADLPRLTEVHVNGVVLAFTVGVSVLTALLFGLAPALRSSQAQFADALRQAGRGSQASRRTLGSALVIGQIAISLGLLTGGGVLLQSFWRLIHVNPGFQPQNVVTAKLDLPGKTYGTPAKISAFMRQFEKRVSALPGVQAVGAISELPLTGEPGDNIFHIEGRVYGPSEFEDAQFRQVSPGYLKAMGIPLLAGRWVQWSDTADTPLVVVVDEAFAKQYFARENPIGKRIQFLGSGSSSAFTANTTIVGVVGAVNHGGLDAPRRAQMYVPVGQNSFGGQNIVVRTTVNPGGTAMALQGALSALDKNEALSTVRTMQDVIASSVSQPRFSALLVGIFAVLAMGLAAVGLYGIIAYSVSQRTNEIGIRKALGATPKDIFAMILGNGIKLALAGVSAGVVIALGLGRFMQSLLFEVRATDIVTISCVAALLLGVAVIASYIPARRAMGVDPMVALRHE